MPVSVGDDVTADWGNSTRGRYLKKAAGETVTSSITPQDDDTFVLTLAANTVYEIRLNLLATGAAAGDIRVSWVATGTVTSPTGRAVFGPSSGVTTSGGDTIRMTGTHAFTTQIVYGTDGTNPSHVLEEFLVDAGVSGGTLKLQWAQGTSSATATTVLANSWLTQTIVETL